MSINLQNGGIALILFGVMIVIVGIIGGGIEIKEIKIPPMKNIKQRIVIVFFGVVVLLLGCFLDGIIPLPLVPPQSSTPTAIPLVNCPSADTVANLMNLPQERSKVQPDVEPCSFHWGDNGAYTTQAHCPEGYALVTVQITPSDQTHHPIFYDCRSSELLPPMLGAVVRFGKWNPTDICSIAKTYKINNPQDTVEASARCHIMN